MLSVTYAHGIRLLRESCPFFLIFSIICDCYKKKNLCTFYFLAFALRLLLCFPFPPQLMLCSEAAGTQKNMKLGSCSLPGFKKQTVKKALR